MAETLASIHPLVVRTLDSLKNARLEDDDLLKPVGLGCLDVRVSRSSLDRAIRIIDALINALESRGFAVSVSNGLEPKSSVEILGEPIQFALTESMERVEQELTSAEKKERLKSPWLYSTPRYESLPSGRLELIIKDNAGQGLRKRWADRENKRLEDQLNAFLAGLIRIASEAKSERIELERERKEREAEEQRKAKQERRLRKEAERLRVLDSEMTAWQKARMIRAYITDVRERALQTGICNEEGSDLAKWISWVSEQADRIDPITSRVRILSQSARVV